MIKPGVDVNKRLVGYPYFFSVCLFGMVISWIYADWYKVVTERGAKKLYTFNYETKFPHKLSV